MEEQNTDYLSSEVQEILGSPPSWVMTWGTAVLIGVVILLGLTGFFFTYPDTVPGKLILTTAIPPVPVVANHEGHLASVKVREGDMVNEGDVLAIFSSKAKYEDVVLLEQEVEKLSEFDFASLSTYRPDKNLVLGEVSQSFSEFVSVLEFFPFLENKNLDNEAIVALNSHVGDLERDILKLESSKNNAQKELGAVQEKVRSAFYAYDSIRQESAGKMLVDANQELAVKKTSLSTLQDQLEKRRADLLDRRAKILELTIEQKSDTKEKVYRLQQSLSRLKNEIRKWKEEYIISAPAKGTVSFFSNVAPQEYIEDGTEVFSVVPPSAEQKLVGKLLIDTKGSGKVRPGQPVNIRFDRYPFREYGQVRGRVELIYPMSKDTTYLVDVSLENGLVTHTGKKLDFYQRMSGTGDIITEEKRFITRIFKKVF
jgi:multidrug resistance efflux pump